MSILVLDGANILHRARSGFQLGDFATVYNFFRQLRPLVDQFKPSRAYMTLEGAPKRQLALLPEYKANRIIDVTTDEGAKKQASLVDFRRQRALIVELVSAHFPISVVQHPNFEGDDVIMSIVNRSSSSAEFIVVSTDSDFTQMLQNGVGNVRLYNPVTKKFVEAPVDYDYVLWKALNGDASDNIPALVTEAKALQLAHDPEDLEGLRQLPAFAEQFERNHELIALHTWTDAEAMLMQSSAPTRDWAAVKAKFNEWAFKSITKDGTWDKYVATFNPLWG